MISSCIIVLLAVQSAAADLQPARTVKLGIVENVDVGMHRMAWSRDGRWIAAGFWREESDRNGELIGLDLRIISPESGAIEQRAAVDRVKRAVKVEDVIWVSSETQPIVDFLYRGPSERRVERWSPLAPPPRIKGFSGDDLGYKDDRARDTTRAGYRLSKNDAGSIVLRDAAGREIVLAVPDGYVPGQFEPSSDGSRLGGLFQKTSADDTTLSELTLIIWIVPDAFRAPDTLRAPPSQASAEREPAERKNRRPVSEALTARQIVDDLFTAVEQRDLERFRKHIAPEFLLHDISGRADDADRFMDALRSDFDNLLPISYRVDVVSTADLGDSIVKADVRWYRRTQARISGEEWLSNEQSATFLLRAGKLISIEGEAPFGISDANGVIRVRYGTIQGATPPAAARIELGSYKDAL